jgi:hypothetical protein
MYSIPGVFFADHSRKKNEITSVLKGPYLGQSPPGTTPELFAPGIVSTGFDELFGSFTPDGKEFYYILAGPPVWTIMVIKNENGVWSKPEVAPFSQKYTGKFCLAPDGNSVVITSRRPKIGTGPPSKTFHAWNVKRRGMEWSKPEYIENLDGAFAPSMASNGNLYFFKGSPGNQELYISELSDGKYTSPRNLGDKVNSPRDEADPYIAPDESYLLFNSNRSEGVGIYICFKKEDGTWTRAQNMGIKISPLGINVGSVTPDGKYLFLFSIKNLYKSYLDIPITLEDKLKIMNGPGNGSIDIFWMDAGIIYQLRSKTLSKNKQN